MPIELLCGYFFLVIALTMVGPGQQLGRALAKLPNRLEAYTIDILGSIAGIVLFAACSFMELSPAWWFAFVVAGLAYFLRPLDGRARPPRWPRRACSSSGSRWRRRSSVCARCGRPTTASVTGRSKD